MKKSLNNIKYGVLFAGLIFTSASAFSQVTQGNPKDSQNASAIQPPKKIKKNIISFGFFSPLNHHISFGYDMVMKSGLVFTSQLGLIGPGITSENDDSRPEGAFVEAGIKLYFSPDYYYDGIHRYNAMQGGYFKPQIVVSVFNQVYTNYYPGGYNNGYPYVAATHNYTYTGVALIANFGKQWIFSNSFSLDIYMGLGYNITSNAVKPNGEPEVDNYFSYLITGADFPLAIAAGMNIGVPF